MYVIIFLLPKFHRYRSHCSGSMFVRTQTQLTRIWAVGVSSHLYKAD